MGRVVFSAAFQYNKQRFWKEDGCGHHIRHCNADWRVDFFQKDVNLFAGGGGIAFKVLTAAVLVVLVLVFVREYRANRRKSREEAEPQKKESPEDQDGLF